jgi:hypothetical protein
MASLRTTGSRGPPDRHFYVAHPKAEIKKMVSKGGKTAADAARLFKIHPATVSRLLARAYAK